MWTTWLSSDKFSLQCCGCQLLAIRQQESLASPCFQLLVLDMRVPRGSPEPGHESMALAPEFYDTSFAFAVLHRLRCESRRRTFWPP